jgi:two-component system, sensor histidine kinase and response regulator
MPSSEPPRPASPALDYEEAVQRLDGQAELFKMVASIFLEDYPRSLDAIRAALCAGDSQALAFSAHKLKGTLSSLSAHPAQDTASQLERYGAEGNLHEARQLCPVLEERVQLLTLALNALISALPGRKDEP